MALLDVRDLTVEFPTRRGVLLALLLAYWGLGAGPGWWTPRGWIWTRSSKC